MPLGKRYEVYFPLEYNPDETGERQQVEKTRFEQTYDELLEEFDGVTVMQPSKNQALSGFWRNRTGQIFEDKVVTVIVYTTDINRADQFFREFRESCKARFQQEEILIISTIVEIMME
jgi:regulator of sigma D